MIMETEKSQDLQLASRRLRRTNGVSSRLKAGETNILSSERGQDGKPPPLLSLFVLLKPSKDWMPTPMGRAICFTQVC